MPTVNQDADGEWEREQAQEEEDRRRREEPPPALSEAQFNAWRAPRRGTANPTRLDNPLWAWLVRTRWDAYNANEFYGGPSSLDTGPMWCFQRFGKSETVLEDGRIVHIGGEHEDHYDPDFFIYNDVVVVGPSGDIAIHGYPEEEFPPTDFHSATRAGDEIYIIGRLGYLEGRLHGATPVYKLSLPSMRIEAVQTTGTSPGWIYRHSATLSDEGHTVVLSAGERWRGNDRAPCENIDSWAFDTRSCTWSRVTARGWQQWIMRRVDRKPNRLWDIRQARWHRDHAHLGIESHWRYADEPDFAALAMLYRLSDNSPAPSEGSSVGAHSVVVDGVTVRFKEERFWVEAVVEGRLHRERLSALQQKTLATLERLDCAGYEIDHVDEADGSV